MRNLIEEYLCEQQQTGRINSERSMRSYRYVLERHAEDTASDFASSDRKDVKRTLARWSNPNTRGQRHAVLASFYDWVVLEDLRTDNPARQVRRPKRRPPTTMRLTRGEVLSLIAACRTQRERWVILLAVCTGSRVAELASLQGRHLAREGFVWFSADIAKGGRQRWVPVLPELEGVIAEIQASVPAQHYVIAGYEPGGQTLRPRTRQVSRRTITRIVKQVAQRAGITTRIYPHLLRHAFGDHIAKRAGLRAAQALLGHANVQTTTTYTDEPGLDELAESVHGVCWGESMTERRARFAAQMHACQASTTSCTHPPIDMGRRNVVQFAIAR